MKTSFLTLGLLGILATSAFAKPRTPAKGSKERAAIMNAIRPKLTDSRHKPLITASLLQTEKGWAFLSGYWVYADGAPLESEYREGSGTNFSALFHLEKGKWRVKRWLYNGDVQGPEYMRAFPRAPRSIFFGPHGETY